MRSPNTRGRLSSRFLVALGAGLIVLGVLLAGLPEKWIEEWLGVEPDGGNGELELFMALTPIVLGAGLLVTLGALRLRASRSAEPAAVEERN